MVVVEVVEEGCQAYQVPEPGAEDLALGEVVGGGGHEVRAVNNVELHGVARSGLAVDLLGMLASGIAK